MKQKVENDINSWWFVRFRIAWPENTAPSWNVDLLLAHKIILPVLDQQTKNITLWRFHRRAARDNFGHRFSFIFYSSAKTAGEIFDFLKSNAFLKETKDGGLIIQDDYDDISKALKPNIEDTSDPSWPSEIKKSWPYFIQGVCQMWLNLIKEITLHTPLDESEPPIPRFLNFYQKVNEAVVNLWREKGEHSLLHHLNAIFGYESLKLRRGVITRF